MPIDRQQLMLAALAAGGNDAKYLPVQAQKMFFLIDREAPAVFDGPHFNFQPYDYGPFDRDVYRALDLLNLAGMVDVDSSGHYRTYRLTSHGFQTGTGLLGAMSAEARDYLERISLWVRTLNFQQLVTAIYARFPDMKVNSVFRG